VEKVDESRRRVEKNIETGVARIWDDPARVRNCAAEFAAKGKLGAMRGSTLAIGALLLLAGCDKVRSFAIPAPAPAPDPVLTSACPPVPSAPTPTPEGAIGVFSSDARGVKDALSKRVHGERPTLADARLLMAVCANLHDDACVAECQMILSPAKDPPALGVPQEALSPYDQAKKVAPKDPAAARALLLPRAQTGVASDDEKKLLGQVCRKIHDKACIDLLKI
jgi:hypothetical protein